MKYFLILIISFFFIGCSSQRVKERRCSKIYHNNFTEILNEKYKTIYNKDTISYNEIRFECVYSALYSNKVMYDKFGKWNKEVFPSNRIFPILVWENIDLLSNGKKYTVMTHGLEEWKHIYASVMVFDEEERDLLAGSSPEKVAIINLFSDLIKGNNLEKKDFYEVYWKKIDPNRWKVIEKFQDEW